MPTMEIELWWLLALTVLFFALGWIAARIDIKHLLRESRALPLSYFRGLNFLLNEQPDKAIESFIEVVKVDPQTIDLHFALGNLFRRQGEIDRAIRMHQNLLDRPDLAADKRQLAVFELAQDFHRAGLLDRAEELFSKLDGSPFEVQSLGFLLQIFEQEKDWQKAINVTRRMEALAFRKTRFLLRRGRVCERCDWPMAPTKCTRKRSLNWNSKNGRSSSRSQHSLIVRIYHVELYRSD